MACSPYHDWVGEFSREFEARTGLPASTINIAMEQYFREGYSPSEAVDYIIDRWELRDTWQGDELPCHHLNKSPLPFFGPPMPQLYTCLDCGKTVC